MQTQRLQHAAPEVLRGVDDGGWQADLEQADGHLCRPCQSFLSRGLHFDAATLVELH